MDAHFLCTLLREIDTIPVEDIDRRYRLLCELMASVKKEVHRSQSSLFRSTNILSKLLQSIDAIPEHNHERRYFQLVSLMIFIKRQARLENVSESRTLNQAG